MGRMLNILHEYVREQHPQFARGIEEAAKVQRSRFESTAELFLGWANGARGINGIQRSVDAYVQFTTDVNLAQARYEASGHYENQSFADVYDKHYSQDEQMQGYLWGIFLTNFLWAHHMEISLFYEDRFLHRLSENVEIIEIAPGHGGWGVWALTVLKQAQLRGFDISASSIEIARSVAKAAGVQDRARYEERDALVLGSLDRDQADAVICSFLIEHLEQPQKLFGVVEHLMKPGGRAFVTGALTAAQVDHIFEFRHESELVAMAEQQGLRVVEMLSTNPCRLLPKARFVPRSIALLLEKPQKTIRSL